VIVVADSGVLILFHATGHLGLLQELFGVVKVPDVVASEVLSFDLFEYSWIAVVPVDIDHPVHVELRHEVDAGEAAALFLALQSPDSFTLIDDLAGRRAARARGLRITGSLGVVLRAKQAGIVEEVGPLIDQFVAAGAWFSESLMDLVLRKAREAP
jgi:predicted nucleic acid-binding protein